MPEFQALQTPIAFLPDASLSLQELLTALRRKLRLLPLLREALAEKVILQAAHQAGLSVSRDELQQAANRFRTRHGLTSVDQMQKWLLEQGLTALDFEDSLRQELLLGKFRDHLVQGRLNDQFTAHRDRYARARLRQLIVPSEGAARELLSQMRDEGRDFVELARSHSLDPASRATGGDLGIVARWQLLPAVAGAVFAASPGSVVGPLAIPQGFALLLVEELLPAQLDEAATAHLRRELFDSWLHERLSNIRFDLAVHTGAS